MARFVDRVESRRIAIQVPEEPVVSEEEIELRSKFPERIFDQNILDSGLSDHVNNLLQEAGYLMVGDLAIQVRTDPDLIYKINGIGPKALAEITNLIDSLEAEMAPVVEEDVEEEPVETETALELEVQEAASETTAIEEEVAEVVNEPVVEEVDLVDEMTSLAEIFTLKPEMLEGTKVVEEEEDTSGQKSETGKKKKKKFRKKWFTIQLTVMGESMMDYTIEDITLLTTIAENIGSAVERARLQKQAERAAVAEERQRLARELHDSISQLLYSLVLYAGAGRKVLNQGNLQNTSEYLRRIDQTSQQALKEMRLLVYELRPSVFREEGLVGALNCRLQAVENRTGMNAQLLIAGEIALDEAVELALYRITEEALNNTLKHAEANQVVVSLSAHADQIDLEIWDNGKGFNLTDGKIAGGLGLTGIQERVSHLGGQLDIQTSSGKGTRIHVHLEVTQ